MDHSFSSTPVTQSQEDREWPVILPSPGPSDQFKEDRFAVAAPNSGRTDMVWVIDNSGSMSNEAEQVRNNFEEFIDSVSALSDLKLALISAFGTTDRNVAMPSSAIAAGHIQLDYEVKSHDALGLLASAICAPETTSLGSLVNGTYRRRVCGQDISESWNNYDTVMSIRGRLSNFFRADARKVFVIVTDDDAKWVTHANFLGMVSPYLGEHSPSVFSFRGSLPSTPDCAVAATGVSYNLLASVTGGNVFDICLPDWQPHFARLTNRVDELANSTFSLTMSPVKYIVSVEVDGVRLAQSSYQLQQRTVTIFRAALPMNAREVVIKYAY